jgi:CHAT domain-containing protein
MVGPDGSPQEGFLHLRDIYGLRLDADLVVLSGCRTALGRELRGEGLVGLTRGFLYAGAPRVVASLWKVEDRATSELMTRFYRALWQEGLAPAAALRSAQLSLRRERRWRDPYFWAGFVLQGAWS